MARPKNNHELPAEPVVDHARINNVMAVMVQDGKDAALAASQHEAGVISLAAQLRYEGATDPATLENSAREAVRRIGMGIFELGGYLLLLRESCPHGTFLPALERIGIAPRAAQQYMSVTHRFAANTKLTSHLGAVSATKMVELLPLDDEQVGELLLTGQTGELALDDVATMSVKELRAAVRELRQDAQSTTELMASKNEAIDKLRSHQQRIKRESPDERLAGLRKEASALAFAAQAAVQGNLRNALQALMDSAPDGADQTVFMAGLVGSVMVECKALMAQFDLPDVSSAADAKLAAEVAEWADKP